jgi:hypothetical protein
MLSSPLNPLLFVYPLSLLWQACSRKRVLLIVCCYHPLMLEAERVQRLICRRESFWYPRSFLGVLPKRGRNGAEAISGGPANRALLGSNIGRGCKIPVYLGPACYILRRVRL